MNGAPEERASGKLVLDRPAEAVARITIRNPSKRNALDHEILDGIATADGGARRGDLHALRDPHR